MGEIMAAKSKEKPAAKASVKASVKAPTKAAAKPADKAKAKASKEKALTKTQLIGHLAEKFELSRNVAGEILESIAELALSETGRAGQFVFPGLGKLVKAERKARVGIQL